MKWQKLQLDQADWVFCGAAHRWAVAVLDEVAQPFKVNEPLDPTQSGSGGTNVFEDQGMSSSVGSV